MILSDNEKEEFGKWLERFSFFTDFANSNQDISCAIRVYEYNEKLHVRVYYGHLKGYVAYGDHVVEACEFWGIGTYSKYLVSYVPGKYDNKTWLDVYNDEYKLVVRDRKINSILDNEEKDRKEV